jgi:2-amino-4-hydroxy-6-hydroxymethyldihydropteridine diphosphokinase
MPEAVLGLGGNLGARRAVFDAAIAALCALPACRVLARSRLYATPPLGPPQPDYLNAAVRVDFVGDAEQLLACTQRIEVMLGRERRERWGARTLDIDLLHWSEGPLRTPSLEVPHRELGQRNFALAPLLDVAPELAPSWQPVLTQLGGAPPLAQPGWPALVREGAYLCGDWLHDEAELGSQLARLLGHALEFAALGPRTHRALVEGLHAHAFSGPGELFDGDGQSWLSDVVQRAFARGFAVHGAAVIERDEARSAGVLIGHTGPATRVAAPLAVAIEARATGERRVTIHSDAPERGFDFNGSGTM